MDKGFRARCCSANTVIMLAMLLLFSGQVMAETQAEKVDEGTRIIGDRDVPPGLYIMPWRSPGDADIPAPSSSVLAPPEPVDADSLRRRIRYQNHSSAAENK